jgi:hypothetical protein
LEKGKTGRGEPKTPIAVPIQDKVPHKRYTIAPLAGTFLKDLKFWSPRRGVFEISLSWDMLILTHESKNQLGVFSNSGMYVYLFYIPTRAVCAVSGSKYELEGLSYVVYTGQEISQERIKPLWSLLEAENRYFFDWGLDSSIIGVFKIQERKD